MKNVSGPLLALMQGNNTFTLADLYTITLSGGTILRYTDFDVDLVYGGNTFSATGPVFKRGKTREVIGLEVDTLDVEIYPKSNDLVAGVPMLAAVSSGAFDNAELILERAYMEPVPTVVGTIRKFSGTFADVDAGRSGIRARINSDAAKLQIQLPRNLYQAACLHTLYDADCGLNRASFAVASSANTGSTASSVICGLSQATAYFDRGYIQFTSGALSGIKRTVKGYTTGSVSIFNPFPAAPAPGDTFMIYPGCDKAMATCQAKFSNLTHFRGMPFIPVPETAR